MARTNTGKSDPDSNDIAAAKQEILIEALVPLSENPELCEALVQARKSYEQVIDEASRDRVIGAEYSKDAADRARMTVESFQQFIEDNKDEITALQTLYNQPYAQRLSFTQIKELAEAIGRPPRSWTPDELWQAYETLDGSRVRGSAGTLLTNLVTLVRYALRQADNLVPYPELVDRRFEAWMIQQQNTGRAFTDEQRRWLKLIRDHVAASLSIEARDLMEPPFSQHGGLGKARELFRAELDSLLQEMTEALAA